MDSGHAHALVESVARGELTARQATDDAIARIEAGDGEINAVVVRDFDRARAQADAADELVRSGERRRLLGLPMTVKESNNVAGLPTTWGFSEHSGFLADRDATLVRRLKQAGAIILGKTNVPPGLADLQTANPVYGVTHNPHRHGYSPGGSSGGSAAALAAGFVTAEVGSDIAGSIRTPAAFSGVWGLRPTYGVVPLAGHSFPGTDGADVLLAAVGPLATSAADLDLLLGVIANHPLRPAALPDSGLRVAVLSTHPLAPASRDIVNAVDVCADRLVSQGASVDRSPELPDLEGMHSEYIRMLNTVMFRGTPPPGKDPLTLKQWFDMADGHARTGRAWDTLLRERYDVILAPVFGTTAFPTDALDLGRRTLQLDGETVPCAPQLAWAGLAAYPGLPAVSFPVGTDDSGLPIGLQVIGPRFADRSVIDLAGRLSTPAAGS